MFRVRCSWYKLGEKTPSERTIRRFRHFGRAYLYAKRRAFDVLNTHTLSEAEIHMNSIRVHHYHPIQGLLDVFVATIVDEADDPKPGGRE